MKRRAIFWLVLAPVVEAGSGDVGVVEPFLDPGDVGLVRERVRRRRSPHLVYAQPVHFTIDARLLTIFPYDVPVNRGRVKMLVWRAGAVCSLFLTGRKRGPSG